MPESQTSPGEELYIQACNYHQGTGVQRDYQKAAELFRQAADRGMTRLFII